MNGIKFLGKTNRGLLLQEVGGWDGTRQIVKASSGKEEEMTQKKLQHFAGGSERNNHCGNEHW